MPPTLVPCASQDQLLLPEPCFVDAEEYYDESGILGFGPDYSSQGNDQTIVGFLADKGTPKIFATLLCEQGGLLWVGGYNPEATTSAPRYTPMSTDQGYYLFDIDDIIVGGERLRLGKKDIQWCTSNSSAGVDCMLPQCLPMNGEKQARETHDHVANHAPAGRLKSGRLSLKLNNVLCSAAAAGLPR